MLYTAFIIALTIDVKIAWFGRHMAICVNKRHKNVIVEFSQYQKFADYALLYLTKTENIFKLVYPLWTQTCVMISGIHM